jgi:V/A-type H+-transporting ATPase subunit A
MIREDFLMQSAYHPIDTYCIPSRAHLMMKTILKFYDLTREMMEAGVSVADIRTSPVVYRISRMKDIPNEELEQKIRELWSEMEISLVAQKGGVA